MATRTDAEKAANHARLAEQMDAHLERTKAEIEEAKTRKRGPLSGRARSL
jgi:hypothetical protein